MLPLKTLLVVLESGRSAQPVWQQAVAWAAATGAAGVSVTTTAGVEVVMAVRLDAPRR